VDGGGGGVCCGRMILWWRGVWDGWVGGYARGGERIDNCTVYGVA